MWGLDWGLEVVWRWGVEVKNVGLFRLSKCERKRSWVWEILEMLIEDMEAGVGKT